MKMYFFHLMSTMCKVIQEISLDSHDSIISESFPQWHVSKASVLLRCLLHLLSKCYMYPVSLNRSLKPHVFGGGYSSATNLHSLY